MAFPLLAVGPVAELLKGILDRVLPQKMSEADKAKLEAELAAVDWQMLLAQIGVNAEEAKSESIFVAGWRPFVGWVCGSAFAWTFVIQPMVALVIGAYSGDLPPLPNLDTGTIMSVLLGMLGLGTLRTFEKRFDVNKNR